MNKAVYAGSFDPITNGHLWMIEQGAKLFGKLVVAIGVNPDKKHAFSLDERLTMLRKTTRNFSNVTVESFENNFLVNYASSVNAQYVLRGIRSVGDYEYEREMRYINTDLNSDITTIFLTPPREIAEISSSLIKGLVGPEGWEEVIEGYIPRNVYNKFLTKFNGLHTGWNSLWSAINAKGNSESVYNEIINLYGEPARAYHNLVHIAHALRECATIKGLLTNPSQVEAAIWFHDAVYNTSAKDNEDKSAQLAQKKLSEAGLPEQFVTNVSQLILATKHTNIPQDKDAQYIIDIDLAILGKTAKEFDEYERDIRDEYAWVPEEQFKQGRRAILKSFLERPSLYTTGFFKEKYEKEARKNLERSITQLS
ncbi:pantetheine-phosphate adenylyltransferase [Candidatus Woesearchaeota archaeon]|nr:pantetheine-phosphate adenylyltransferase [Candidatus Woesearchaeota archaeon]